MTGTSHCRLNPSQWSIILTYHLTSLWGLDVCAVYTLGFCSMALRGRWDKRMGRIERSTSVLSLWKFCKACRRGWVVWSDMDLTSTELKPLAHFYEELGDQCLNRPYLVSPGTFFHPLLFLHCVSVITVFLMFTFLATFVFFFCCLFWCRSSARFQESDTKVLFSHMLYLSLPLLSSL